MIMNMTMIACETNTPFRQASALQSLSRKRSSAHDLVI